MKSFNIQHADITDQNIIKCFTDMGTQRAYVAAHESLYMNQFSIIYRKSTNPPTRGTPFLAVSCIGIRGALELFSVLF